MKIARCFSNVDNVYISKLPASTITLYTMTRLKREVLEAKLQSGEFNTRTTFSGAINKRRNPTRIDARNAKLFSIARSLAQRCPHSADCCSGIDLGRAHSFSHP